jgi:hypothetical protein
MNGRIAATNARTENAPISRTGVSAAHTATVLSSGTVTIGDDNLTIAVRTARMAHASVGLSGHAAAMTVSDAISAKGRPWDVSVKTGAMNSAQASAENRATAVTTESPGHAGQAARLSLHGRTGGTAAKADGVTKDVMTKAGTGRSIEATRGTDCCSPVSRPDRQP